MMLYLLLFYCLGAITTWLCFCWKADKRESKYREKYLAMMDNRDELSQRNFYLEKECEKLRQIINMQSLKLHKEEQVKKECQE